MRSENTSVTEAAITALLMRQDMLGWRLVARSFATETDEHTRYHMTDAIEVWLWGEHM